MFRVARVSIALAGSLALAACPDRAPAPTGLGLSASKNGLPFTEGLASPAWQEKAAGLVSQAGFNPQTATHAYPLLGVAQYLAVQRAEAATGPHRSPSRTRLLSLSAPMVLRSRGRG